MQINEADYNYIAHFGILRRSGRYPWGSSNNETTRHKDFLDVISDLQKSGMSQVEIARSYGISTTELRAAKTIAKNTSRQADIALIERLKAKGWSNTAIGERMGKNESYVRSLLAPGVKDKNNVLNVTVDTLAKSVAENKYVDIGAGNEAQMGISAERLRTAVAVLKEKGYTTHSFKEEQLGTGFETQYKVLAAPGVEWKEVYTNRGLIKPITQYSTDGGRTFVSVHEPVSIDSSRVGVVYGEDGGAKADGMMYIRPGVKDVSLGDNQYAQVRVAVDGTHYLKGMAAYSDDLPKGVDILFNTNKSKTGNKLDVMKPIKDTATPDDPFGAITRQIVDVDNDGKEHVTSVMNIVNDDADWSKWSRNLSTQVLSKQSPKLAKTQLDLTYDEKVRDFENIKDLTNPTVKRKLLKTFSDEADSSAVHMEAAALPRQAYHAIIPINSLNPHKIYAPNYNNGEQVVLVRFPHGGKFEIPSLTVDNTNKEAKTLLGDARTAVGIHHTVAERLSGADFDGDTVIVIPNNSGRVATAPALEGLKNFDPRNRYPAFDGMTKVKPVTMQNEMGKVSNLITDMTIHGASPSELARAVRHSMVVIDSEKHNLNYKQSAIDNGIPALKAKYQGDGSGDTRAGASTIISRATSEIRVPERKDRTVGEGGPIDTKTGRKMYEPTGRDRTTMSKRLAETDDAHTLVSTANTPMERLYANHSNKLKALANKARLEMLDTPRAKYSASAKKAYAKEVASLNAKLSIANKNRPLERQAMLVGNAIVRAQRDAEPNMDNDTLRKVKLRALNTARLNTGAGKKRIVIEDSEWEAIQHGALSDSKVTQILANADAKRVRELATPKRAHLMTTQKTTRARTMLALGYTRAEVANALGVSLTTLDTATHG